MPVYSFLIFGLLALGVIGAVAGYSFWTMRRMHEDALKHSESSNNQIMETSYRVFLKAGLHAYAMRPEMMPGEAGKPQPIQDEEDREFDKYVDDLEQRTERMS